MLRLKIRKEGWHFLRLLREKKFPLEDGGLRQGIFTHFLIRGLNGEADANQDKIVTIQEISAFVS